MKKVSAILAVFSLAANVSLAAQSEILDFTGKSPHAYFQGKAHEVVLVNYWATYCVPCKEEMKGLARLSSAYSAKGLLVIGACIDSAKNTALVGKMAASLGVGYPILVGLDSVFMGRRIAGLPTTFLLDSQGRILEEIDGKRSYDVFAAKIDRYLAAARVAPTAPTGPTDALPQPAPLPPGRKATYTLEARRLAGGNLVELRLAPAAGYHLNGPGYPSLDLRIDEPAASPGSSAAEPIHLQSAGVAEGEHASWNVPVDPGATRLTGRLKAIVCGDSLCRPLEEDFSVELR